jgi:hypothetical protein
MIVKRIVRRFIWDFLHKSSFRGERGVSKNSPIVVNLIYSLIIGPLLVLRWFFDGHKNEHILLYFKFIVRSVGRTFIFLSLVYLVIWMCRYDWRRHNNKT